LLSRHRELMFDRVRAEGICFTFLWANRSHAAHRPHEDPSQTFFHPSYALTFAFPQRCHPEHGEGSAVALPSHQIDVRTATSGRNLFHFPPGESQPRCTSRHGNLLERIFQHKSMQPQILHCVRDDTPLRNRVRTRTLDQGRMTPKLEASLSRYARSSTPCRDSAPLIANRSSLRLAALPDQNGCKFPNADGPPFRPAFSVRPHDTGPAKDVGSLQDVQIRFGPIRLS
jgi:hypothetical protein